MENTKGRNRGPLCLLRIDQITAQSVAPVANKVIAANGSTTMKR